MLVWCVLFVLFCTDRCQHQVMPSWPVCRNGFSFTQGAVPLREVMSLRSGDFPPTLKKKKKKAICLSFSVTKLINHRLMSSDISNPRLKPTESLMHHDVSEELTSCLKNHFFNGRDRGRGCCVSGSLGWAKAQNSDYVRRGVKKHLSFAAIWVEAQGGSGSLPLTDSHSLMLWLFRAA